MNLHALTQSLPAFISEHRAWAGPIMMVLAFGESLAFISLVLPFWTILIAVGTVITATGSHDFWIVLAAAAVGAALGDWLSYWLGYHYHEKIAGMWPLNKYPELLPKGQAFFDKWGAGAIWLGRFSGPLRASIPIVAGAVRMPATRFQIANWGSAFLWAYTLMTFGDILGKAWAYIRAHFLGG
ncbi:MAG: DedA family protein [Proteobacteria bacterium]|nr:DedA family protein [Pseudomonadota bacterium]